MWLSIFLIIVFLAIMNILEDKQRKEAVQKNSAEKDSSQSVDKHLKEQCSLTGIYEDEAVVQLAIRCKKGDVSAMRQMAAFFRSRCTPSLLELLDCYESDPNINNELAIEFYLKKKHYESEPAKSYMTWLIRAALYGDAEVFAQLEKWSFYKKFAYISYDLMTGEGEPFVKFYDSNFLQQMGFIDVPVGYDDCGLSYNVAEKYFDLCYVSFYEPPDEYGFGAEWEYSDIYFDEFFCRLPEKPGQ